MDIEGLKAAILGAPFINKGFVKGETCCNYEKYLLELINESLFFRKKANYEYFESPKRESCGECDCISKVYQMDFKLAVASTRLQASNLLSLQHEIFMEGFISTRPAKKPGEKMIVTNFHAALRGYNKDELKKLLHKDSDYGSYERDIQYYLNNLKIKKNLFLFFPHRFYFENKVYNFKFAVEKIVEAVKNDFIESMKFRQEVCFEYETYFSFIYDDNLIVIQVLNEDCRFKIVDVIYLFKSPTFTHLYNTYLV